MAAVAVVGPLAVVARGLIDAAVSWQRRSSFDVNMRGVLNGVTAGARAGARSVCRRAACRAARPQ